MSIQAVAWALEQDISNSGLKLVLICLCNHADKSTGELFLRHKTLESEASMSRSSVQRHIKTLSDMGIIEIGATFDASGRQAANSYRVVFSVEEQQVVAAARRAAQGCQSDTLPLCGLEGGKAVRDSAGGGVTVTPRGSTGDTGEGVTADTPNTNHPTEPDTPQPPLQGGLVDSLFEKIKAIWPLDKIGDQTAAERAFHKLAPADRDRAEACAKTYLWVVKARRARIARLSTYLSERRFMEFYDAPEIESDGHFKITPRRPEWSPWLGDIRKRHGESGVQSIVRTGFYRTKQRWPEGHHPSP